MERARWLPNDMGARFLLVDIPGFELKLFEQGKELSTMRIIVGKEYQRTPMFADTMEFVVVNRSEEHTSELQSLMRISYDVFCWKKPHETLLNLMYHFANYITGILDKQN